MRKIYVGIDNGITGSIAIIEENKKVIFTKTPTKKEQSYTKTKQIISRIDYNKLCFILDNANSNHDNEGVLAIIERPMVNPGRFKATVTALRSLEATLIALEYFDIAIQYIDSKEWQKVMLPKGLKKEELKKASLDIGCRLFPYLKDKIIKHKDADSLLIAEYARRKNL